LGEEFTWAGNRLRKRHDPIVAPLSPATPPAASLLLRGTRGVVCRKGTGLQQWTLQGFALG